MFSLIVISAVFWLQWRFRRNVPFEQHWSGTVTPRSSGCRQELFGTSWCEIGVIYTLRGSVNTWMRCLNGYLKWRGLPVEVVQVVGRVHLRGKKLWRLRAYRTKLKAFSSGNQLLGHECGWKIVLPPTCCGWSKILNLGGAGSKSVFREVGIGLTAGLN